MLDFNYNNIFSISDDYSFNKRACEVFEYQFHNCDIYKKYCRLRGVNPKNITKYTEIPFLPISFFKSQKIFDTTETSEIVFNSSGTTSEQKSMHYVAKKAIYEQSFLQCFELFYGKPQQYCFLALLPSYLEREGSSLVYMCNELIKRSNYSDSGFYLDNFEMLAKTIAKNEEQGIKSFLIGVSFALVDFAKKHRLSLSNTIIMETGGMKGRKEEITREQLHNIIKSSFTIETVHSEYGMTELLSQAYSNGKGIFSCPPWMKVLIREINDPFSYCMENQKGGINIIDLANIHSCSFIETQDLGIKLDNSHFRIEGRFDKSDVRGCNLMYS